MAGTRMEDNKKLSPLIFIIIGLAGSILFGLAESQYLLSKSEHYRDNVYWKAVLVFYLAAICYLYLAGTFKYRPFFSNMLIFTGKVILLLIPFISMMILRGAITIPEVLTMLPAHLLFIPGMFIWLTATEIDPDLEEKGFKLFLTGVGLMIVIMVLLIILELNEVVILNEAEYLTLMVFFFIMYSLWLLWRAQRKNKSIQAMKREG